MYYAMLKKHDNLVGPGSRVALLVSGCLHHCTGCINPKLCDFNYGKLFTGDIIDSVYRAANHDYIAGLSILGGEPFEPSSQPEILKIITKFKEIYPHKTVWCFSGYDFEKEIMAGKLGDWEITKKVLALVDVIVNGVFHENEQTPDKPYIDSANQKLIDVQKSLKEGKAVLWVDTCSVNPA
jgi:anaerobic ribonucleoside-triphosphate reductase activating protein